MGIKSILKSNKKLFYVAKKIWRPISKGLIKVNKKGYIGYRFKKNNGYTCNFNHPSTFNEKVQWIKLNYYNPNYTLCADKFRVRQYIADKIGEKYLTPCIGIYDSVEEIDFEKLPFRFVIKPTHGFGEVLICKDKSQLDWKKESRKIRSWLKENQYDMTGEWQYKDIKPKIICEELLEENINDYKFFCFSGQPMYIQVDYDRFINHKRQMFDVNWNRIDCSLCYPSDDQRLERPAQLEEMLEICKVLSEGFEFVRVDLYSSKGKVYFGELTFTPGNGMDKFMPYMWDEKFGALWQLPVCTKKEA